MGTHVHPWLIPVNVWQNQYSIVKQNKVKKKKVGCSYQKNGVEADQAKTTDAHEPEVRNLASLSPWRDL